MTDLEQLIQLLSTQDATPQSYKPTTPRFFVHFVKEDLRIASITSNEVANDGQQAIEIDYDLGLKFITGEENPISWGITTDFLFQKIQPHQVKLNRIDVGLGIYEVQQNDWDDIRLKVLVDEGAVEIYYDGEKLKEAQKPVKMYFTREGDMTYLKCAFSLDVNILNDISQTNKLTSWPNPVRLNLQDVDDLSIYAVKGPLSVSITNA